MALKFILHTVLLNGVTKPKGNAAVYCVIIGFANFNTSTKKIFDYEDIKGEAHEIKKNINPYLIDAKDILIEKI